MQKYKEVCSKHMLIMIGLCYTLEHNKIMK